MRYPLAIYHGHFQREFSGWRETPPIRTAAARRPEHREVLPERPRGESCVKYGYDRMQQEYGYQFYKQWTGPDFPRVIMVTIQHANPYYDDSYAVNSENLGPYGDAITYELIPAHRADVPRPRHGWARAVYGGSTGGWEALGRAGDLPGLFNGAWANCPDPIDFRSYTVVNIYQDANAYYPEGPFKRTPRPGKRDYLGQTRSTVEQNNLMELVLGTKSRSGGQWDIWEAVLLAGRRRRVSEAHLGQADRRDRQGRRRLLARALRSRAHHAARLGDARPQARAARSRSTSACRTTIS